MKKAPSILWLISIFTSVCLSVFLSIQVKRERALTKQWQDNYKKLFHVNEDYSNTSKMWKDLYYHYRGLYEEHKKEKDFVEELKITSYYVHGVTSVMYRDGLLSKEQFEKSLAEQPPMIKK